MYRVFIIHGIGASSESNWFPWLKAELERLGTDTIVPDFPSGKSHNLTNWLATFKDYSGMINNKTVMIGHSLGPVFILTVLESLNIQIRASFLVAPSYTRTGSNKLDRPNSSFIDRKFDWDRIRKNCEEFYVYASDNDPYVPIDRSRLMADKLNAVFRLIPGVKHFTAEAGYLRFDELLSDIKRVVSSI